MIAGPLVHEKDGEAAGAAFSPDGRILATLSGDNQKGSVNFWDVETGKLLGRGPVSDVAAHATPVFSPDGKLLATQTTMYGLALVWDVPEVPTPKLPAPRALRHGNPSTYALVYALEFSPDGRLLAVGSFDGRVHLWDTKTWKLQRVLNHPGEVRSLAFEADGRTILTGCADKRARRWDVATGEPIGSPLVHDWVVAAIGAQPGGDYYAVAGKRRIQLWDRATEQRVGPAYYCPSFNQLLFAPDQRTLHSVVGGNVTRFTLPRAAVGDPESLRLYVEVLTGFELTPNGEARPLEMDTWLERSAKLKQSGFRFQRAP